VLTHKAKEMKKQNKKTQSPRPITTIKRRRSKKGRRISDLFPDLANYAANDHQTTQDLLLTESEFGSKYRKGKSHRLQELETKNIKIAYENLRLEHARVNSLGSELDAVLRDANGTLHHLLTVPKTPQQATALLRLWFINNGPKGSRIQVTLDDLQTAIKKLELDDIDTEIARRLIFPIGKPESVQDFASRVKLARQSIYPRIRRIMERFENLSNDKTFAPLIEAVNQAKTPSQTGVLLPLQHPLIPIALLPAIGPLGDVSDLIRIAMLCAAHQETSSSRKSRQFMQLQLVDNAGNQALHIN